MMSNATKGRRSRGGASGASDGQGRQTRGAPRVDAGAVFSPTFTSKRGEVDPFRAMLLKLRARYEPSSMSPPENGRFRVRGEVLPHGENYFTVEMGCIVKGVINMPWGEYPSSELEIRWGSKLELARLVLLAVNRSQDRIGKETSPESALRIKAERPDLWKILTMSAKDYKSLPREDREQGILPVRGQPKKAVPQSSGFYSSSSEKAKREMETISRERARNSLNRRSWSDEVDEDIPLPHPGQTQAPPSQQRAGSDSRVPPPSSSAGRPAEGFSRQAPPASTFSGEPEMGRRMKSPTPGGGTRVPPPSSMN